MSKVRCNASLTRCSSAEPVRYLQRRHPIEIAQVVRHKHQAFAAGKQRGDAPA